MKTPYERGRASEYAIKRKLENMGYRWIIRSAGSHSPADLIASNGSEVMLVQVKGGGARSYIDAESKQNLAEWARYFKARPMVAVKNRGRSRLLDLS